MRRVIIVALIAAGSWVGWIWLSSGDEAQIIAVLERIADGVSGGAGEGEVGRLARAAALRDEFAPDVVIDAGPPFGRLHGREAIIGAAARTSGTVRNLDLSFPDVSVVVAADRQTATALVTAQAQFDRDGARAMDARELDIVLTRVDGAWVISTVKLVSTLQRLDGR